MRGTYWLLRKIRATLIVYWARALEYRIVLLIWILAMSVPLVMMAVWLQMAEKGNVGSFSRGDFIAYYMANLLIVHLVSTWHGLELSHNIRRGELNALLLKPFHPLWIYALRPLPTKPLRIVLFLPPMILITYLLPDVHFDLHPLTWVALLASMILAYALMFLIQTSLALLSFWMVQAEPLVMIFFHLHMLFSGYLVPLALFPPSWVRTLMWLPFRFTLSVSLEIVTGALPRSEWIPTLGTGLGWVVLFYLITAFLWRRGIRVYTAVGA